MAKKIIGVVFGLLALSGLVAMTQQPDGATLALTLVFGFIAYRCLKRAPKRPPTAAVAAAPPTRALSPDAGVLRTTLFAQGAEAARQALINTSGPASGPLPSRVLAALPQVVDKALEDGVLTRDEEDAIRALCEICGLKESRIPDALRKRLLKAALVRDLLDGVVLPRLAPRGLPFTLQNSEVLVWAWRNVPVYEHKTVGEYVAGSQGVSVRIAKGVYWRMGAVKGRRIEHEVRHLLGSGPLAVTSRHLYYLAGKDSQRIRLDKLVSVLPTDESVIVHREGARSKPLEWVVNDPCFLANVLSNARNWG